jgi:hypothetical protein
MRKILIISAHFPPSNLAAVHRARLFAQHLPEFGWEPIILTVDEKYYEELLDWNLFKLLPEDLEIHKVHACKVSKPRIIGDLGLRAFFQLLKKALKLVRSEHIDFVYIPIPSFYSSLIGPILYKRTGVKYGIDYIDPWVHFFPGSEKKFSRHWMSSKLAKFLEPIAVKHAALITGVADGYFKGVQQRNPKLLTTAKFGSMPYGGEKGDHFAVKNLCLKPYLFHKNSKLQLVYAGAILPKAYPLLEQIFRAFSTSPSVFQNVEFHFIGTGKPSSNIDQFNIRPLAEHYGLWGQLVFEYPQRIPYLDVLIHLESSDGIFILGSTEPHYTPSKTYQAVLSGKPILAVLHEQSSAVEIIRKSRAGVVLSFNDDEGLNSLHKHFTHLFSEFRNDLISFQASQVDHSFFELYSAKSITEKLVRLLDFLTQ